MQIAQLKSEIAVLKNSQNPVNVRPSKLDDELEVEDIVDLSRTQEIRQSREEFSKKVNNSMVGNQKVVKLVKKANPDEFYKHSNRDSEREIKEQVYPERKSSQ